MIGVHKEDSVFAKAMTDTCEKYGIHYGFASRSNPPGRPASDVLIPAREKYAALDIYNPGPRNAYKGWQNGPAAAYTDYNPLENYIIADPDNMAAHRVGLQAWHPGYLDDFIWFDANKPGNTMTWVRVMDVEWMTSERCKKAIIENKIELINTHDALFGTNIYQDHLKAIGSPLWVGNFAD